MICIKVSCRLTMLLGAGWHDCAQPPLLMWHGFTKHFCRSEEKTWISLGESSSLFTISTMFAPVCFSARYTPRSCRSVQ